MLADYVSVKIDTVNEKTWQIINRPFSHLRFDSILKGISDFSYSYNGLLVTETMLVNNINDNIDEVSQIKEYLNKINRTKSYFNIPIRPPSEIYAIAPNNLVLKELSEYIKQHISDSETLFYSEEGIFKATGNFEEEFLGIISVHPMREDFLIEYLQQKNLAWDVIKNLLTEKKVEIIEYLNQKFYTRRF